MDDTQTLKAGNSSHWSQELNLGFFSILIYVLENGSIQFVFKGII